MLPKPVKWISLVAVGAAVSYFLLCAAFVGWWTLSDAIDEYRHEREFSAAEWRNPSYEDHSWPTRLCMVDDLIASRRLDGLSRELVLELLGNDNPANHGYMPLDAKKGDLLYHLGPERGGFRIDSEWLFVEFNDAGIVKNYRLCRD